MSIVSVAHIRVLYADTDQMGVVNNGIYLRFFEIGRAEWLRQRGRAYKDMEDAGYMLPVVEAHVRYREPARYDDVIDIHGGPVDIRAASVKFEYRLFRVADNRLLSEGYTLHACLTKEGKVRRFPDELLSLFHPDPQ
ncbi:MAG TPA: thioesterase family protein [Polyangia bacterium]|jgi:acyl-CoA thioester hydrolase|nr:thioesterase family protein [Polyangia bacterium]